MYTCRFSISHCSVMVTAQTVPGNWQEVDSKHVMSMNNWFSDTMHVHMLNPTQFYYSINSTYAVHYSYIT